MSGGHQGAFGETIYSTSIIRSLEQDVFPMIGELSIAQLKPPLILAVLREIELCGAIEPAKRVAQSISVVFVYVVARHLSDRDRRAAARKRVVSGTVGDGCVGIGGDRLSKKKIKYK